jgi:acetyl esterase/lipase
MKGYRALANILALLSASLGGLVLVKNKMPFGLALWFPKLFAGAVSPFASVAGLAGALLGLVTGSPLAFVGGLFGAYASARHVWRVVAFDDGFAGAFGADWWERVPKERKARMLQGHWTWRMPAPPQAPRQRDVPFATIPGTARRLLCDLWRPPEGVKRSGLAFLYLHGSAWFVGDKDMGTRFLFRHLAAQGHVVMDVAYRMSPETDMFGMVGDAKRAIAWMKQNASRFGVATDRIVVGGGSAGAHLALLAAYTPRHPQLTPDELEGLDLTVRGVVSVYGPTDMVATYYHTRQDKMTRGLPRQLDPNPDTFASRAIQALLGADYMRLGLNKRPQTGAFVYLLDGHPDQVRATYELFSPVYNVQPACPATLLIHGQDDFLVPATATAALARKLREVGVPVVLVLLPQTDHAFDLVLPRWSPPAQSALYEIERFLALMAV